MNYLKQNKLSIKIIIFLYFLLGYNYSQIYIQTENTNKNSRNLMKFSKNTIFYLRKWIIGNKLQKTIEPKKVNEMNKKNIEIIFFKIRYILFNRYPSVKQTYCCYSYYLINTIAK